MPLTSEITFVNMQVQSLPFSGLYHIPFYIKCTTKNKTKTPFGEIFEPAMQPSYRFISVFVLKPIIYYVHGTGKYPTLDGILCAN